ncbi:glycosyltransferase family 4 protein [Fructilactobacillus fructivorans]|uniref:Undecaprenyl/decaprenyl-phosphate alpha-N-acetylglucosaminyl 1-phosphate transferase n=1 Tax=Fructilactobacillus fructivorans TaxID=1614 RepID=A0AAE6P125_9LACO|nr:MraY family glycosyltransferase [Fructilactobacillus fructivorans]QFX92989.1 undecaprenyl/decaprenyl-phosphate alpha-N-acetylglucosaminyl 1-phosphate transferase [Fructilactobacillus fructivorans]RDV65408.1 undecaprenyl/decaprenyl-phosphate alpha-N-acetylglucosaminyl 1-phosphate transferase [Fructilactobacillus fructivorans]
MKFEIFVCLFATTIMSAVLTPFIRILAFKIGAIDKPNKRRVNKIPMPTLGGLAILIAYTITTCVFLRNQIPSSKLWGILGGELIIVMTGIIDDIFVLKPRQKVIGISLAALWVYIFAGIQVSSVTLPVLGNIQLGWLSLPLTWIWILGITNSINLIDGLDGLATGVAIIALTTMGIIALFFLNVDNIYVSIMIFTFAAACLGFLPYNFFPARIYLGDTGSLLIGFMISVFSLQGLKNATFISVIIPVVILGVPISDTAYAILRRLLNKQPISHADKHHLHHRLMQIGLTHRQTVLVIYGIALIFAFISLLYPLSSFWGSILLTVATLIGIELFVEAIGLVGKNRQPLLNLIKRVVTGTTSKSNHEIEVTKMKAKKKAKQNKKKE